jgi:hypothetical protein
MPRARPESRLGATVELFVISNAGRAELQKISAVGPPRHASIARRGPLATQAGLVAVPTTDVVGYVLPSPAATLAQIDGAPGWRGFGGDMFLSPASGTLAASTCRQEQCKADQPQRRLEPGCFRKVPA